MSLAASGPCEEDHTPGDFFAAFGAPTVNCFTGRFYEAVLV